MSNVLASLTFAPRAVKIPVTTGTGARVGTGTCDAVTRLRVDPLLPGNPVLALSAGAGTVYGVPAPWGDKARHCSFQIGGINVTAGNNVIGQVTTTAGRATTGKVVADLVVSFGASGGRLQLGVIPTSATAIGYADMLKAILLVNGVPYTRILDDNSPAPAAKEWGLDANTDAGYTIVIGADSTDYLPVGAQVDILIPDTSLIALLAKPGYVAGAALVAGVPEERVLGVPVSTVDMAGRTVNRLAAVDFVAGAVAATTLVGMVK